MVNRSDVLYLGARAWVCGRVLRPKNLLHFVKYLMLETARHYPGFTGLEKRVHVEGALEDIIEDPLTQTHIRNKLELQRACDKLVASWIDTGIKAHKQKFVFRAPESEPPTELPTDPTNAVITRIADIAEEWFKNKTVTASNIIMGITTIMQAASKFFNGDGDAKRDMVLHIVSEIVHRETTAPEDRDAILMAIDTFGTPVIDFLIDLSSGQFDFKGVIAEIKAMCAPLCSCCPNPNTLTDAELDAL